MRYSLLSLVLAVAVGACSDTDTSASEGTATATLTTVQDVDACVERSGPRNLDSGLSEIFIVVQAAVPTPVAPKYTTSGVCRPSAL